MTVIGVAVVTVIAAIVTAAAAVVGNRKLSPHVPVLQNPWPYLAGMIPVP